jgi:redox-sensitive bicupin YhaK (pirin superfamily)
VTRSTEEQIVEKDTDVERPCICDDGTLVTFDGVGDAIAVTTEAQPVRFLLVSGEPLNEPVAWHGPIVMNTRAELKTVFEELNNGTFLKNRER